MVVGSVVAMAVRSDSHWVVMMVEYSVLWSVARKAAPLAACWASQKVALKAGMMAVPTVPLSVALTGDHLAVSWAAHLVGQMVQLMVA
jgi:hypothetical protein